MKRQFIVLGMMLVLVTTSLVPLLTADDNTDLIAGKHMDAGDVIISNDASNIYVKFVTSDGWFLTEIHVDIASDSKDLAQTKKGNAIPGKFEYKDSFDAIDEVTEYTQVIPIDGFSGIVYIAAHAVVCKNIIIDGGLDDLVANLPNEVSMQAKHAYNSDPAFDNSYFRITIYGTSLDGTYDGWCVDTDHNMKAGIYDADVYSSTESISTSIIEKPWNLDLVNYILNQHWVGKTSGCGGLYTYGDVQRAIWELIEDFNSGTINLGDWDQCRVDEILTDASNHDGFVPDCGDVVAIILEPQERTPDIGQTAIIELPINCEYKTKCETAWGKGDDFPGNDWSMYIPYTIEE